MTVIFDIDGTLIDSVAAAGETYRQALLATVPEATVKPQWSDYRDVTDTGIMIEVLEDLRACHGTTRQTAPTLAAFETEFMSRLRIAVAEAPYAAIPGAADFLTRCQQQYPTGIATGCWRESGQVKLASAGISIGTLAMASASDHATREDILRHCHQLLGGSRPVVYFGDAVWDVRTTTQLGWTMIGIGPKVEHLCPHWFPDYREPERILETLARLEQG